MAYRLNQYIYNSTYKFRLSRINNQQNYLFCEHILPSSERVKFGLKRLRTDVDNICSCLIVDRGIPLMYAPSNPTNVLRSNNYDTILKTLSQKAIDEHSNYNKLSLYPIGLCHVISDIIYKYLHNYSEIAIRSYPELSALAHFHWRGGIFKPIWGHVRNKYFQSALQVGLFYVDVANDTVDLGKEKIVIQRISDSDFNTIDTLHLYSKIINTYHERTVYINTAFPDLLPFSPLLTKTIDRPCWYLYNDRALTNLALRSNFESTLHFLKFPPSHVHVLDSHDCQELVQSFSQVRIPQGWKHILSLQHLSIEQLIERINQCQTWSARYKMAKINLISRSAQLLNSAWGLTCHQDKIQERRLVS